MDKSTTSNAAQLGLFDTGHAKQKSTKARGRRKLVLTGTAFLEVEPAHRGRKRKPLEPYVAPTEDEIAHGLTDSCRICEKLFLKTKLTRAMYCINCQRAYTRSNAKRGVLKHRYGLGVEEHAEMIAATGGACPICRSVFDDRVRFPAVDHNHRTGAVRGIICQSCNVGLGHLQDKPQILRQAAEYIRLHQASEQGFSAELYRIDHLSINGGSLDALPERSRRRRKSSEYVDVTPLRSGRPRKPIDPYVAPTEKEITDGLTKCCPRCKRIFLGAAIKRTYCVECERLQSRARSKSVHLKGKYGLSMSEYEAMLKMTGGKCLICKKSSKSTGHWPVVDHDHGTGAIRGIICHHCNFGIGHFGDDADAMERAASYLDTSRYQRNTNTRSRDQ
jgi:uncharacterized protein (DUF983 family)